MQIRPDTLADGGCWISDDRVYALITAHGIAEIGYHGRQPVSRNSRILVHETAAVRCSAVLADGRTVAIGLDTMEWEPGRVRAAAMVEGRRLELEISAAGRGFTIRCAGEDGTPALLVRVPKGALFTEVQGERTWQYHPVADGMHRLSFRDTIVFNSWIRRSGPYRGDFLIPEAWRRILFRRRIRSGDATLDDVLPQYRDCPLPLYDATAWVSIGGSGFTPTASDEELLFAAPARVQGAEAATFEIRFEDDPPVPPADLPRPERMGTGERPRLIVPGYPHIEAFMAVVPDLVDSCVISDFGVPRATPGRYYWIWAWDLMVTAAEMLRWGDVDGARRAVRFVLSHRDIDGRIPGRWTRDLSPLDTPEEGAGLDFLLAHLAYELFLETRSRQDLLGVYPELVRRMRHLQHAAITDGLVRGRGFYPDLPGRYGRSEHTATALESGSWYALCRILQNIAHELGDTDTAREAQAAARRTAESFGSFWDPDRTTLQDAIDLRTGTGTGQHPVFTLLFLQTPLALSLLREHVPDLARFIQTELLTDYGLRTVPYEERGDGAEVILDAWYPHWDLYAVRLFRKTGQSAALLRWLSLAEGALERLGYCPEYLSLEGFRDGDPEAWKRHGAPSNLNCASGWYRAFLETLLGIELDPGGMTIGMVAPLRGEVSAHGLPFRRARWDIVVHGEGPSPARCLVDGVELGGVRKIPLNLCEPGRHRLEVVRGDPPDGIIVEELVNVELLHIVRARPGEVCLKIRPLGPGEVLVRSATPVVIAVDGSELPVRWDPGRGLAHAALPGPGAVEMTITAVDHSG